MGLKNTCYPNLKSLNEIIDTGVDTYPWQWQTLITQLPWLLLKWDSIAHSKSSRKKLSVLDCPSLLLTWIDLSYRDFSAESLKGKKISTVSLSSLWSILKSIILPSWRLVKYFINSLFCILICETLLVITKLKNTTQSTRKHYWPITEATYIMGVNKALCCNNES